MNVGARLKLVPVLLALLAATACALPVAVKNAADVPLEGYAVFFTVERDRLAAEGIDPASMCAVDPAGSYLPLWVVPETLDKKSVAVYVKIPYLAAGDQIAITLTPGPCKHDPKAVLTFFDDFKTLDTRFWAPFASPAGLQRHHRGAERPADTGDVHGARPVRAGGLPAVHAAARR